VETRAAQDAVEAPPKFCGGGFAVEFAVTNKTGRHS
jgi:hypothetical protein